MIVRLARKDEYRKSREALAPAYGLEIRQATPHCGISGDNDADVCEIGKRVGEPPIRRQVRLLE